MDQPKSDKFRSKASREENRTSDFSSASSYSRRESPLDKFFLSFPSFNYDPSLPPATSFKLLQTQQRWRRNDLASNEGWDRYQNALAEEFQRWYGSEDDLEAWHALCRAIRIEPLPVTNIACKLAVRNRHVNMIDLIQWGREGGEGNKEQVKVFRTVKELGDYCRQTGKIFRNDLDEDSEKGGLVLRHLLRRIFTSRPVRSRRIG